MFDQIFATNAAVKDVELHLKSRLRTPLTVVFYCGNLHLTFAAMVAGAGITSTEGSPYRSIYDRRALQAP